VTAKQDPEAKRLRKLTDGAHRCAEGRSDPAMR
jgi:hypothetical protein